MNILILMGQRKCLYPEQYAPEVLEAIDENGNDDNPDFLIDAERTYLESEEFDAVAIIAVEVSDSAIERRLSPKLPPIKGKVIE